MSGSFVSLSFLFCTIVLVGSCPLHQVRKQQSVTDELPAVSTFESPQKEREGPSSIMGGYLTRNRRSQAETKQEENQENVEQSPRATDSEPDRENELEVGRRRKRSNSFPDSSDEIIVLTVDHDDDCPQSICDPPSMAETVDLIDESPFLPNLPEEGVNQFDIVEDNRRKRAPDHHFESVAIPEPFIEDNDEAIVPHLYKTPDDRLAILITGEPIIYHPRPFEEEILAEFEPSQDVVDVVLDTSDPLAEDVDIIVDEFGMSRKKKDSPLSLSDDQLQMNGPE